LAFAGVATIMLSTAIPIPDRIAQFRFGRPVACFGPSHVLSYRAFPTNMPAHGTVARIAARRVR
jgi:hypothetical protein